MKGFCTVLIICVVCACNARYEVPVPNLSWQAYDIASTPARRYHTLPLEGIYAVRQGHETFGAIAVVKSSYRIDNKDTSHFLSVFFNKEVSYIICKGKVTQDSLLLKGYWRKNINTETGEVRLVSMQGQKTMAGEFGNGDNTPDKAIELEFQRPLIAKQDFFVLAHRGGGRNSDLLPASENSINLIKMASQYGATGIEIDVRLTQDCIPVIYHDETLNERATKKSGLVGKISNYTYAQLSTLVSLPNGETIPTLQETLDAVVYSTPLRFVWLDIKAEGSLVDIESIRKEYMDKAAETGRSVQIVMGIPDENAMALYKALPNYQNIPAVSELDLETTITLGAQTWAPRWTLGPQNEAVQRLHSEGKKVFTWTLDEPQYIEEYVQVGNFDGILSNYPTLVAHYYYVNK